MSDSNGSHDGSASGDEPVEASGDHGPDATADRPIPEPVTDAATAELVRDAIDVARGELSDRQFSEKYGTATAPETVEAGEPEQVGETACRWAGENR